MKKYILLSLAAFVLFSCVSKRKDKLADDELKRYELLMKDSTTVQVIDTTYNFGTVTDGQKVEYSYRFRNSGNKPLVVANATASCGCTVPQKPEKPIMPGDTGYIKIVFDSKGRVGSAHKSITVISNAKPEFPMLQLTGEVLSNK